MSKPAVPAPDELEGVLGQHALLGRLQPDLRAMLLDQATVHTFGPAEAVCREGFSPTRWYLLLEGEVRVTRTRPDGGQELLARLAPGAIFGIVGLLAGRRRAATAAAVEASSVLAFRVAMLQGVGGDTAARLSLELREVLALSMTRQLRTMNRRLYTLGRHLLGEAEESSEEAENSGRWLLPTR